MKKSKPVIPSLREKKRYLAFEIISKSPISKIKCLKELESQIKTILGVFDSAKAGVMVLNEKYDSKTQKGILKVNNRYLGKLKAAIVMIETIASEKVIIRSLGTSGMIGKASEYI